MLLPLDAIAGPGVRIDEGSSEARGEVVVDENVHILVLGFGGEVGRKKEE